MCVGLKSLLLERKLEAVGEQLEMKDAQLAEVLTAANLEPATLQSINSRLQEVLENKNSVIKALQYDVAKVRTGGTTVGKQKGCVCKGLGTMCWV